MTTDMTMYEMLKKVPDDIEAATNVEAPKVKGKFDHLVICGMGGSGIAGDILRDYLKYESKIPVFVVKSSRLPKFVNNKSLVIAVSYSGQTWETLSCIKEAKKKKAKLIVVTSGETKEKNSMIIPGGTIPRMSLSQLFFPLLSIVEKLKLIGPQKKYIRETIDILRDFQENNPNQIAEKIHGMPFIYGPEHFSSVVLRWRNQMNENSKLPAHSNVFTELNHNDIEAKFYERIVSLIILRDKDDEGINIEVPKEIFKNYIEIQSEGKSLLARMFYMIYFGDWVSYYLALKQKVDPVKNDNIDYLKRAINEYRNKK